ncbi:hypothetical protein V2J09_005304 [Rumex salicifolius]
MSDNPLQPILQRLGDAANGIGTQFCRLFDQSIHPSPINSNPLVSISSPRPSPLKNTKGDSDLSQPLDNAAQPVTKEELGRATWTFLHALGAQYPENPTRQQKKDVKELMAILSRMYPCKECADHFKEVLRANPVQAGSQAKFSQYLCHVHNVVNRSLGKPIFPCERVDARWGKLDCEKRLCDLLGETTFGDEICSDPNRWRLSKLENVSSFIYRTKLLDNSSVEVRLTIETPY